MHETTTRRTTLVGIVQWPDGDCYWKCLTCGKAAEGNWSHADRAKASKAAKAHGERCARVTADQRATI